MTAATTLERLAACAGRWEGSNRLHDPHTGQPEDTAAGADLSVLLGGRFLRLDYTWVYQGADQAGSLLIGYQSDRAIVTVHWIDSWHMSESVMLCQGTAGPDGSIDVRGSYSAGTGPDWGWRIALGCPEPDRVEMVMHNVDPEGHEEVAVECELRRQTSAQTL